MDDATATPTPICRATRLIRELAPFGAVRVVMRTCSGMAEVVCSTGDLSVEPPWAVLTIPGAHVNVELAALRAAELRPGCTRNGLSAFPTIAFVGRCGSPCMVVVLDRAAGTERTHQETLFRALRARWGARVSLEPEHAIEGDHWLH